MGTNLNMIYPNTKEISKNFSRRTHKVEESTTCTMDFLVMELKSMASSLSSMVAWSAHVSPFAKNHMKI
jgi:hypothetical protein